MQPQVPRPLHTLARRPLSQVLKRLTSSVSCALDEAAAALTRMRSDPPGGGAGGSGATGAPTSGSASAASSAGTADSERSLVEACNEGDINKVSRRCSAGGLSLANLRTNEDLI